jgi:glucose/arabinose dehydrogenase
MRSARVTAILFSFVLASGACSDDSAVSPAPATAFEAKVAFPNLSFSRPVDLQNAGDGSNRLFVVEQAGRIRVFENADTTDNAKMFLDISSQVLFGGEQGLLGLAFDPNFSANRHYFVYYSISNPRRTRVSRFTADSQNPDTTLVATQQDVIAIDQPYGNHNGGQIAFGPDDYLYIGLGDGGSGDDPDGNGQNRTTLLGSILRINVGSLPYTIPPDNPFVGNQMGYREEIYAWGLRNPWRFSFDPVTDWLWVGDVGQRAWEEIDVVEKGKNYGWNIMEASHCRPPALACDMTGLELPVWEYGHPSSASRSITGGYVYRGSKLSGLVGFYIYADYETGEVWALQYSGGPATNSLLDDTGLSISSFGVDQSNELYICAFDGRIYSLVAKQ